MDQLHLDIITQEKSVFQGDVDAIVAPATEGEVTILPHHIALFTKLHPGEIKLLAHGRWQILASAGGFMDVSPQNKVTILADSAVRAEEINLAKAEAAKRRAEERLREKLDDKEYAVVEADLRKVIIELKVARKHRAGGQQLPGE